MTINIQGNIIAIETILLLGKDPEQVAFQSPKDFGIEGNNAVRDDISRAWSDLKDQYNIFQRKQSRWEEKDTSVSDTRKFWLMPLFEFLGYEVSSALAEDINGKSYAISHRANNLDGFPLLLMGYKQDLDRKPEGLRMSPHALVQEYINLKEEYLYALVSNGKQLRLLRDAANLTKLNYLEFDLVQMLEEDRYADFAIMYRLLHRSRMPQAQGEGDTSKIERLHQAGLESGARIRENLAKAVEEVMVKLGSSFMQHHDNEHLRANFEKNPEFTNVFFNDLLHLVYRLLFLMVIEERKLIFDRDSSDYEARKENIYYQHYSLSRLRRLADRRWSGEERFTDLWQQLQTTFKLFEKGNAGEAFGIKPLAGDLFSANGIGNLAHSMLDNHTLLTVMRRLSRFRPSEKSSEIRVNYGSLDVEEFGSIYEGMLEYKAQINTLYWTFTFVKGTERSKSGSHYTPDELVHPLIKHSLSHVIQDRLIENAPKGKEAQEKALLSISVCDVACGSGHILLAAARHIGLAVARVRTGEDQPNPKALRLAVRDAIQHCIYGVDLNPLAVELCKVALWLEAHNPGAPLNFLDHKIKCGNAIVGLAHREELEKGIPDEAFKALANDDKALANQLKKTNSEERKNRIDRKQLRTTAMLDLKSDVEAVQQLMKDLNAMPERTTDEIIAKRNRYKNLNAKKEWWRLKNLCDIQTAQFFIPKTNANICVTDAQFDGFLRGLATQGQNVAFATAESQNRRFFHWFLEFPEVFAQGGFDCILGNPPFLGGQKLSGNYGESFLEYIKYSYAPIGAVDLVTYFFRRIFSIIKENGFQSLISTNTIAQGSAREGGLEVIMTQGGAINHAIRSMKWPGLAAVEVAMVTIHKGDWNNKPFVLDAKKVAQITSYLDDADTVGNPLPLKANENKSFQGSIVLGKGFVLEPHEAMALIAKDEKNRAVLFPYLNGEDLNNNPDQSPSRWVINFKDYPLRRYSDEEWAEIDKDTQEIIEKRLEDGKVVAIAPPHYDENVATDFPDCLEIVERLVKPERQRKDDNGNYVVRMPMPELWWIYGEKRPGLYRTIAPLEQVLVVARISKTVAFDLVLQDKVFADATVVIAKNTFWEFAIIQSTIHNNWAWKYCTTMKADLNYTPSETFGTFPMPSNISLKLNEVGENYKNYRANFMRNINLGLTKTYNLFHCPSISSGEDYNPKIHKQREWLIKHLAKTPEATYSLAEVIAGIEELRRLHLAMDEAVLRAYGWEDLVAGSAASAVMGLLDFHEVEYLPENDRLRYTLAPEVRKEVLRRLLALNHARRAEEEAAGLWDDKKGKKGKKIEVVKSDDGQGSLF